MQYQQRKGRFTKPKLARRLPYSSNVAFELEIHYGKTMLFSLHKDYDNPKGQIPCIENGRVMGDYGDTTEMQWLTINKRTRSNAEQFSTSYIR